MRTLLAGRHSPRAPRERWERGDALASRCGAGTESLGPLNVVGKCSRAAAGSVLCAWTGRITGLERLADELRLAPGTAVAELLAEGYRRFGTGLLERLRGAFVLALWDSERGSGLVGTDLMGQCALFWRDTGGELVFASELRELLAVLEARPAPDELSVVHMLTRPGPPRGRTPFEGVKRLETGSCLELGRHGARVVRHWQPRYEQSLRGSRDELAAALRDEVRAAVRRSLDGAERAAVLLSGGIDSSISAAVASELDLDLRAYSGVFPDLPDVDETEYLDSVVAHTGIGSRRFAVEPRGSLAASLEYLDSWEVAVPGAGYLLERALVAEAAKDGMGIVLDGQGGDEVFGATPYVAASDLARGRLLRSIRTSQSTPWTANVPTARARFALWRSAALNPWIPDGLFQGVRRLRGRELPPPAWLTPDAQVTYAGSVDDDAWKRAARGPIWWRYMSDLLIHNASGVRCDYIRHRSALRGLESRPPLLDVDLTLFALRLPPHLSMDPERDRPLARDAMRGVLPEKVRTRTVKSDLSAFYREITTKGDIEDVRRLLLDPGCEVYRYVDREQIRGLAERPPDTTRLAAQVQVDGLHACAIVECWLRRQGDPASTVRLLDQVKPGSYAEIGAPTGVAT
jgi:asparagine synthase (glutamine-hydrolysing)